MSACCQVTTTLPDEAAAERLAQTLVQERLAACAQVIGPLSSTYWWEGRLERGTEWYCHLKTTVRKLPAIQQRLAELHPYELPELVAVPLIGGDPRYLRWIAETLGDSDQSSSPAG